MARLPRYEKAGITAIDPGRVEFAGLRERQRFSESIGRMAAFVEREVEERRIKRTREEEAARQLQQKISSDSLLTAFSIEMTKLSSESEASQLPYAQFQAQAQDLFDGYTAAVEGLDPDFAPFAVNDMAKIYALKGEQYSAIDQKRVVAEMRALAATGLEERVNTAMYLANSESFNDQLAANEIAEIAAFMETNQYSPAEIAKATSNLRRDLYKENVIASFERLTSIEEKQDYIDTLDIRQLGPDGTRDMAKSLQTKLNTEITRTQSLARDVKSDIKEQAKILTKGGTPSKAEIADLENKVSQFEKYDPELRQEMDKFEFLNERLSPMKLMTPLQLQQELLQIEQGVVGQGETGLDTIQEVELASAARGLLNEMTSAIEKDPLAYAARVGHIELAPLNINDPRMVADRVAQSRQIAGIYGISPTYLTDAESDQMANVLSEGDTVTKMAVLESVVTNFGNNSPDVFAQVAPKKPELAHIGGLVSLGNMETARVALQGIDRISEGNKPVDFTPTNTNFMYQDATETAFNFQPEAKSATREVANAIYAQKAFERGLEVFDSSLWEESINLAAGYNPKTGKGGLQEVRGTITLLPSQLDAEKLEDMLDEITADDILENTGLEVTPGQIRTINDNDTKLYVHSDGYYYMGIGEPGTPGFRWIADKRQNKVVIDALKYYGLR